MKTTRCVLWAACLISGLGAFYHLGLALKTQGEFPSYHDLGLDTPEFVATLRVTIRHNLIEGTWYLIIAALVALSIRRLSFSN